MAIKGKMGLGAGAVVVVAVVVTALSAVQLSGAWGKYHDRKRMEAEITQSGRVLFESLRAYRDEIGRYPSTPEEEGPVLDTATLDPLRSRGGLTEPARVTQVLCGNRLALYQSPDIPGPNNDFWALLVHAEDPGLRAIVADTAYFPGHEGDRLTGVYLIRGSELVRVH